MTIDGFIFPKGFRYNSTFKQKATKPLKRSKLRLTGVSDTSKIKDEIQGLVRAIVILRDGGCVLREVTGIPKCNGYAKDGHLILQADHLLSRSNSATYGDTRLIVCVCKGHHGWKSVGSNLRKTDYDMIIRELILTPEKVVLWDLMEATKHKAVKMDWKLVKLSLEKELASLKKNTSAEVSSTKKS